MTIRKKAELKLKKRTIIATLLIISVIIGLILISGISPVYCADKLDPFHAEFQLTDTRNPQVFDIAVTLEFSIHNSIEGKLNGSKFLCNEDIDSLTVTDPSGRRLLYTVKAYPRKRLIWEYPPADNGVRRVKISFMIRDAVKLSNNQYIINIDWLGGWKRPVVNATYSLMLPSGFDPKHILTSTPAEFVTETVNNKTLMRYKFKNARDKGLKVTLRSPEKTVLEKPAPSSKPEKTESEARQQLKENKKLPLEATLSRIRYARHTKKSERIIFEFNTDVPFELKQNKASNEVELIWKKELKVKKDLLADKQLNTGFMDSYRWKKTRNKTLSSVIKLKKDNIRVRYGSLKNPDRVYLDLSIDTRPKDSTPEDTLSLKKPEPVPQINIDKTPLTITPKITPKNNDLVNTSGMPKEAVPPSDAIPDNVPIEEKIHFKNAAKMHEAGDDQKAIIAFRELLNKYPDTALQESILYRIADAEYNIAEKSASISYEKALSAYQDAVLKYPGSKNASLAAFRQCECKRKDGLLADAVNQYTYFLKKYPSDQNAADAAYWIAELHYQLKQYKKALSGFESFLKKSSGSQFIREASFRIGDCYLKLNDFDRAEYYYEKAFRKWPDTAWLEPETLNNIAVTYYYKGRFNESRDIFMQSFNQYPDQENRDMLLRYCADTYQWEGNMQKAVNLYGLQLELFPESDEAKLSVMRIADIGVNVSGLDSSHCYFKGFNPYTSPETAYKWLLENDHSEKTWTEAYYKTGFLYAQKGQYETALAYFKKSMNQEPGGVYHKKSIDNITKMLVNLINQAAEQNDHIRVIDLYSKNEELFLKNYKDCSFKNRVAESFIEYGFLGSAENLLGDMLEKADQAGCRHQAAISLAKIDLERKQYSKAADKMKILLYGGEFLDPPLEEKAHHLLGDASFFQELYQDAVTAYAVPLKKPDVAPENYNSVLRIGRSFAALGYYYNGIHSLNRYIRLIETANFDEKKSRELKENAMLLISNYLTRTENYDAAINVLDKIENTTQDKDIRLMAGVSMADLMRVSKNNEAAIKKYTEISEKGPYNFYGSVAINKLNDIKWRTLNSPLIKEFL